MLAVLHITALSVSTGIITARKSQLNNSVPHSILNLLHYLAVKVLKFTMKSTFPILNSFTTLCLAFPATTVLNQVFVLVRHEFDAKVTKWNCMLSFIGSWIKLTVPPNFDLQDWVTLFHILKRFLVQVPHLSFQWFGFFFALSLDLLLSLYNIYVAHKQTTVDLFQNTRMLLAQQYQYIVFQD